jgi:hypothetical protein
MEPAYLTSKLSCNVLLAAVVSLVAGNALSTNTIMSAVVCEPLSLCKLNKDLEMLPSSTIISLYFPLIVKIIILQKYAYNFFLNCHCEKNYM